MDSIPITIETLAARVLAMEKEIQENRESHGKIYARLENVETGHAVFDNSLSNIWAVLKEIQADVREMKGKPGKRWESLVNEVLKWLVLAVLGAAVVLK